MSNIGKFAIERGEFSSTIYRIERETAQRLYGPTYDNYRKEFIGRARQVDKGRVVAVLDTLDEALARLMAAKAAIEALDPGVEAASAALIKLRSERREAGLKALRGES